MGTITVSGQLTTFALSLLLGTAYSLLYDLFRIFHIECFKGFWQVFISDILYWLILLFFTYSFLLLYCNGSVRGYVLFGCLIGFVLCRATLSKIFIKLLGLVYCLLQKLFKLFMIPLIKLYELILHLFGLLSGLIVMSVKKIFKKRKKHLERDKADGV